MNPRKQRIRKIIILMLLLCTSRAFAYDYVLFRNESKIKVNLKKVFAGLDLSPGNQYEMSLMVNYSLDDTPYMQEINYKVVPYETKGSSEWIYRLFPETGI